MAECFHRFVYDVLCAGWLAQVTLDDGGGAVELGVDPVRQRFDRRRAAVGGVCEDDFGVAGGEVVGERLADAAGGTGYDGDLVWSVLTYCVCRFP